MKKFLGSFRIVRLFYFLWVGVKQFFKFRLFAFLHSFFWFSRDIIKFKAGGRNPRFKFSLWYLFPMLADKTSNTPLDATYFYQDTWAARKIFENKPEKHYDIGSNAMTIGVLSQFVPITMIDIRPLPLKLNNLSFVEGSILSLPFENNCISSLSTLCVVEHIGLGRYGDPIDVYGSDKAVSELIRVLKPEGNLYFSVPVDNQAKVCFNAQRTFTKALIMEMFKELELVEDKYQYGNTLYDEFLPEKGYGTGLYHFRKR